MGPVNWLAVVISALAAAAVWLGMMRARDRGLWPEAAVAMLVSAAMLGHSLARIGAEKLAVKPWLYFMQSGGLALAFVVPALWIGYRQRGVTRGQVLREGAVWIAAYLAMGAVFWALR